MQNIEVVRLEEPLTDQLDLIASRMQATLIEVLGPEVGVALYSLDWLKDRATSHLDGRQPGAIFVARTAHDRENVGHIIVRQERDSDGPFGLVSTIYVLPSVRRHGVAAQLVVAAHGWFESRGLSRSATDTSETNLPLIQLFNGFGYEVVFRSEAKKMVRLMKASSRTEAEP